MSNESAGTEKTEGETSEVDEFPLDTSSSGKHYQVAVPHFHGPINSYFRHGVPHSGALQHSKADGWSESSEATRLGDDLLRGVKPPEGFDSALGGVRDHTDGNRIVTTRKDVIEVVGGQYRRLILNFQPPHTEEDPDWAPPEMEGHEGCGEGSELGEHQEPSVIEHLYPNFQYEVTSTTHQPKPGSFAEPRKNVEDAKKKQLDIYEYTNGKKVYEVLAAEESLTEKTYGATIYGVTSAIHKDHPEWESTLDDDGHGGSRPFHVGTENKADHFDVAEMIYGHRLLEISRASDYFEERLVCDDGDFLIVLGASRSRGTFTDKTWGYNIVMEEDATHTIKVSATAGNDIIESATAGNDIKETVKAAGAIKESVEAAILHGTTHVAAEITEITTVGGPITEITAAGGPITDIKATSAQFELSAAAIMLELTVAALKVEIEVGARIEWHVGPETIEFHNGHHVEGGVTKTQLIAAKNSVLGQVDKLQGQVAEIAANTMILAGLYSIV